MALLDSGTFADWLMERAPYNVLGPQIGSTAEFDNADFVVERVPYVEYQKAPLLVSDRDWRIPWLIRYGVTY